MEPFRAMREAVGDWLTLTAPGSPRARVGITIVHKPTSMAILPFGPSPNPVNDLPGARIRLFNAIVDFIAATYPEACDFLVAIDEGEKPQTVFLGNRDGSAFEQQLDFDGVTLRQWPIGEGGRRLESQWTRLGSLGTLGVRFDVPTVDGAN